MRHRPTDILGRALRQTTTALEHGPHGLLMENFGCLFVPRSARETASRLSSQAPGIRGWRGTVIYQSCEARGRPRLRCRSYGGGDQLDARTRNGRVVLSETIGEGAVPELLTDNHRSGGL